MKRMTIERRTRKHWCARNGYPQKCQLYMVTIIIIINMRCWLQGRRWFVRSSETINTKLGTIWPFETLWVSFVPKFCRNAKYPFPKCSVIVSTLLWRMPPWYNSNLVIYCPFRFLFFHMSFVVDCTLLRYENCFMRRESVVGVFDFLFLINLLVVLCSTHG